MSKSMKTKKIGFSKFGGIFIGELESSKLHQHTAITVALSLNGRFKFENEKQTIHTSGVISQPNSYRRYVSNPNNILAFVHIEPLCAIGLPILDKTTPHHLLSAKQIMIITDALKNWYKEPGDLEKATRVTIECIAEQIEPEGTTRRIDSRIQKTIDLIWSSERVTLKELAGTVGLSTYRLSHLFKDETGMSFKAYLLHRKLVKSMREIVLEQETLSSSAYAGGFSDQAHFNRTFLNAFGVTPNNSIR